MPSKYYCHVCGLASCELDWLVCSEASKDHIEAQMVELSNSPVTLELALATVAFAPEDDECLIAVAGALLASYRAQSGDEILERYGQR